MFWLVAVSAWHCIALLVTAPEHTREAPQRPRPLHDEGRENVDGVAPAAHHVAIPSPIAFPPTKRVVFAQQGTFLRRQEPIQIFVPKVGLANLTQPTAFPPPPPVLNPYKDYQPFDTAVGDLIMKQFVEPVTVTPPPSQAALDLAYGCPALLEFPTSVVLEAPSGCENARKGRWLDMKQDTIMNWEESCTPDMQISASPFVRYSLPNGDLFGYSREQPLKGGRVFELLDCGVRTLFTIDEKVFRGRSTTGGIACEKYKSCDGTVYLSYSIYKNGKLMASTPYLTLFEDLVKWTSPDGLEIATASRVGGWNPRAEDSTCSKTWLVKINSGAPPPFNDITLRWPIVEAMNMMALRDNLRGNDGFSATSRCEWRNGGIYFGILLIILASVATITACFLLFLRERMTSLCLRIEDGVFPKAMHRASKFDA